MWCWSGGRLLDQRHSLRALLAEVPDHQNDCIAISAMPGKSARQTSTFTVIRWIYWRQLWARGYGRRTPGVFAKADMAATGCSRYRTAEMTAKLDFPELPAANKSHPTA